MHKRALKLLLQYQSLNLSEVVDFDRFNQYSITYHSTNIECSTLTATEGRLLLEENLTPKGKPLQHSLMVKDHFAALQFVIGAANEKQAVNIDLIQKINALVLKNTGATYRTLSGDIDSSSGAFMRNNVTAGTRFFPNFTKVESLTATFVENLNTRLAAAKRRAFNLRLLSTHISSW